MILAGHSVFKTTRYWQKLLAQAAVSHKPVGSVLFSMANASTGDLDEWVKSTSPHTQTQKLSIGFQLRDMVESALGVVDEKGNKFRMDLSQGSSLSSTLAFLKRSLSKGAKPWVYSQKPKTVKKLQKKSASKVLIGKTFKKVVLDKTKHCFVSLCPLAEDDCKHHFPTWNELATLLKKGGVDDVVVARVDPIHNDMAAGFSAKPMDGAPFGSIYPTIYFVAKDKKDDEEHLWDAKHKGGA